MSGGKKQAKKSITTLRDEILSDLGAKHGTREISVMTRLSRKYVDILDTLVKLKLFKSRSEAVAAMVMKTISAEKELFEQLEKQAEIIDEAGETIREIAIKALKEQ
jgi:Arc/MetJ-type ribon-helix-helix transcriptional regulator